MNFYGHAVLAAEQCSQPRFVLGAMLPDLVGMVGLRLPPLGDPELRAGVDHHHLIDACFHRAPAFLELVTSAFSQLCDDGVPRGPARAVAHVGVELLLDGWLATHDAGEYAYRAGLAIAAHAEDLQRAADPHALERLSARLQRAPLPQRYCEPTFVAERLAHVLQSRPRLRLSPEAAPHVVRTLNDIQDSLSTMAAPLIAHVRDAYTAAFACRQVNSLPAGRSDKDAAPLNHVDAPRCLK